MQTALDRFQEKRKPSTSAYEQDRELATRVAEGDREALVRLVDRHIGPVNKYLNRLLGPGNEALAGDIVEATFEELFRRIEPYARGNAALPMRLKLFRLANKHLAKRRRLVVRDHAAGEEASETLIALRQEMSKLPMRHQVALALALFEEMPPEEMAEALRTTPAGAMRLLRSALKRIGKRREDEGFY